MEADCEGKAKLTAGVNPCLALSLEEAHVVDDLVMSQVLINFDNYVSLLVKVHRKVGLAPTYPKNVKRLTRKIQAVVAKVKEVFLSTDSLQ